MVMRYSRAMRTAFILLLALSGGAAAAPRLDDIRLPPGFRISIYAEGMERSRSLAMGARGTLFVGTTGSNVYAIPAGGRRPVIIAPRPDWPHSVGFDWDPRTKEFWFTDNGRDLMGNDVPPDELNHAPKAAMDFGFPYCHGGDVTDPEFGRQRACKDFTPPAQKLGAHVASLGMRFYTGTQFPQEYRGAIFIAEHGSWNREPKSGYRVTVVKLKDGRAASYEPFAQGWLQGNDSSGRPVDVIVAPDGALLVSADKAGIYYCIAFTGR